jgi:hypothetical protein
MLTPLRGPSGFGGEEVDGGGVAVVVGSSPAAIEMKAISPQSTLTNR